MIYKLACFVFACGAALPPALAFGSMAEVLINNTGVFTGIFVFVSIVDTLLNKISFTKK